MMLGERLISIWECTVRITVWAGNSRSSGAAKYGEIMKRISMLVGKYFDLTILAACQTRKPSRPPTEESSQNSGSASAMQNQASQFKMPASTIQALHGPQGAKMIYPHDPFCCSDAN